MKTPSHFLIAGAGLAGLQCALILSRYGHRVTVLEQNEHVGGTLQSFAFKGAQFSTGLHYIGSLDEGQVMHRIFRWLGLMDQITYRKLDEEVMEVFDLGDDVYHFPQGWERFRSSLKARFPEEAPAIDAYVEAILHTVAEQDLFNLEIPDSNAVNKPSQSVNAWDLICSFTTNERLRQVLGALNFVYAGERDHTPWYVHALINHYFVSSSYRVVGPTQQIPDRLTAQIEALGSNVHTRCRITHIGMHDDRVEVHTADGSHWTADHLISNIHPAATLDLVTGDGLRPSFRKRLQSARETMGALVLYIKLRPGVFAYRNHNFSHYAGGDTWAASSYQENSWPRHFFMHFPVPETGNTVDHVSVMTHMRWEEVSRWQHTGHGHRDEEYRQFCDHKAGQLLQLVEDRFPGFGELITGMQVATPLTFRDYIGSPTGSMYGTLRDYRQPLTSFIGHRTRHPRLWFTGQNLNLHGIMGVSLSALLTCSAFVPVNTLINDINEKN